MSIKMVSARELVGKTIVAFDPGAIPTPGIIGTVIMHEPRIWLSDGSVLLFETEEHTHGDFYGCHIQRVANAKPPPPRCLHTALSHRDAGGKEGT